MSGIPDEKSRPSAFVSYQSRIAISPPATITAGQTWDMDFVAVPDPVCFGSIAKSVTGTYQGALVQKLFYGSGEFNRFMNQQIAGYVGSPTTPEVDYKAMTASWTAAVRDYRLGYYGATVEVDAPAVSDQGMITATQYEVPTWKYSAGGINTNGNNYLNRSVEVVPWDAFASFTTLQNLPGVYAGKAKDGCYLPFKLSQEDFEFRNVTAGKWVHGNYDSNTTTFRSDQVNCSLTTGLTNPLAPVADLVLTAATGVPNPADPGRMLPRTSRNVGHVCIRGISAAATVYIMVRCGFEVTTQPGSIFTPYIKQPVAYDDVALKAYFGISRQLADAYPSSYNSLATLLPVIAGIAGDVLPKLLPHMGTVWREVKGMFGQTVPSAKKEKKQVEKVVEEVAEAAAEKAVAAKASNVARARKAIAAIGAKGKKKKH